MQADLERAKRYQRKKYTLALLDWGAQLFLILLLILSNGEFVFRHWAESVSPAFYVQLTIYFGLFFAFLWIFDSAFAGYSGYYLEKIYDLSNQTFISWTAEFLKKTLLSFGLSWVLVLGLYTLIHRFPTTWWIAAWLGFAGLSYLLGQLFPILIIPLFYRYGRVDDEELKQRIFRLTEQFKLPLENVYSLNLSKTTKKANALFAGLGRTKRLVLADTLIQNFTPEEIESVVAHELGHYVHRDIWHHLGFNFITSFASFALAFHLIQRLAPALGYRGPEDLAAFPLLCLIFYLLGTILTPVSNAYSRWREREADRFAIRASKAGPFILAMEKLAQMNLADPRPHPVIEWWFYTHPPIKKRIEMAKEGLWVD